jgi:hypothetical protein
MYVSSVHDTCTMIAGSELPCRWPWQQFFVAIRNLWFSTVPSATNTGLNPIAKQVDRVVTEVTIPPEVTAERVTTHIVDTSCMCQ